MTQETAEFPETKPARLPSNEQTGIPVGSPITQQNPPVALEVARKSNEFATIFGKVKN
jgi:hypothetical protein